MGPIMMFPDTFPLALLSPCLLACSGLLPAQRRGKLANWSDLLICSEENVTIESGNRSVIRPVSYCVEIWFGSSRCLCVATQKCNLEGFYRLKTVFSSCPNHSGYLAPSALIRFHALPCSMIKPDPIRSTSIVPTFSRMKGLSRNHGALHHTFLASCSELGPLGHSCINSYDEGCPKLPKRRAASARREMCISS
ncbi:hypothetical protein BJV78DRAFT_89932 [Lactifluus subvellereus]|nr:hypothetical protein BJV78DRAFT_89932 [Lactifluus subvellereus]